MSKLSDQIRQEYREAVASAIEGKDDIEAWGKVYQSLAQSIFSAWLSSVAKNTEGIEECEVAKLIFAKPDCGAGTEGNAGFQPGNTCAGEGGVETETQIDTRRKSLIEIRKKLLKGLDIKPLKKGATEDEIASHSLQYIDYNNNVDQNKKLFNDEFTHTFETVFKNLDDAFFFPENFGRLMTRLTGRFEQWSNHIQEKGKFKPTKKDFNVYKRDYIPPPELIDKLVDAREIIKIIGEQGFDIDEMKKKYLQNIQYQSPWAL